MTETPALVTAAAHDCNEEAPDLAALNGPVKSGQPFICSCGRLWLTVMKMARGTPPYSEWISPTESPTAPATPDPLPAQPEGETT